MGTSLGRYDILRTLAKGSLTDLLLGRATGEAGFQRYVAIKQLREEHAQDAPCLEMFVNEARLAAALHHHNIVQVLDIGDENGQPYFAMEYVHGVDLRALLSHLATRSEQLPLQHVVAIIASAAAALHHAHDQRGPDGQPLGLVHRQVTPSNILVGFDGNVKIVDFGIAKAKIKRIQTGVGVLKGSAPYMAPEQCAGRIVDRRSDVFALGIVLYELSTVRRLFKGANEFLTMSAVVNAEVPRPSQYRSDVPGELEVVMLKALARDPLARYQTAGDMANALDKVARVVGVGASTTALANYMKLQFGERKEPWLEAKFEADPEMTEIDFDGAASGLAPPPSEALKSNAIPRTVSATKSSPIAQARSSAVAPRGKRPSMAPLDKSFSVATTVDDPEPASSRQRTEVGEEEEPPLDIASTKLDKPTSHKAQTIKAKLPVPGTIALKVPIEAALPAGPPPTIALRVGVPPAATGAPNFASTAVATPPPPPPVAEPGRFVRGDVMVTDATAIVEPLAAVVARATTITGKRSRKMLYASAGAVAVVVLIAAIALWPSAKLEAKSAAGPTVAEATPQHDKATPEKSALEMTARDYEQVGGDAAVSDEPKAADEAKADDPKPEANADEPKPEPKADEPKADEPKPEPKADEPKPEPNADEPKADEPKADAPKAKLAAADEPKADEPKADAPKPAVKPAAKTAKRTAKKTTPAKRTTTPKKTTKSTKSTKKTKPKWNPDDLFLGE